MLKNISIAVFWLALFGLVSNFICAAYFATIRVVDAFAMDSLNYIVPNQSTAYLASDLFVWLVPLLLFHLYWLIKDKKSILKKR